MNHTDENPAADPELWDQVREAFRQELGLKSKPPPKQRAGRISAENGAPRSLEQRLAAARKQLIEDLRADRAKRKDSPDGKQGPASSGPGDGSGRTSGLSAESLRRLPHITIDKVRVLGDYIRRVKVPEEDLQPLLESIEKLGVIQPILIDRDDIVRDGLLRLQCCRELGLKEIPFLRISGQVDADVVEFMANTTARGSEDGDPV